MPHPPFDFADIAIPHAALQQLVLTDETRERLHARLARGSTPTCAAAVLAEHGDDSVRSTLIAVAGYLDPPDLHGLAALHETDALACSLAAPWNPAPNRLAAAELLAHAPPTAAALCVLEEVGAAGKDPISQESKRSAVAVTNRSDASLRLEADKLRLRAGLVRTWTGIRRQELQREVATGELPAVIALLAGDPSFLATLVPPVADSVRPSLLPALLANARAPDESARAKTLGLFHGRWRDLARVPLSILSRLSAMRGRDVSIPRLAVDALGKMGAYEEVVVAAVSGVSDVRGDALTILEKADLRAISAVEHSIWEAAIDRLSRDGDARSAARIAAIGKR